MFNLDDNTAESVVLNQKLEYVSRQTLTSLNSHVFDVKIKEFLKNKMLEQYK